MKWFKNMKISIKITFVSIISLLITAGVIAFVSLMSFDSYGVKMYETITQSSLSSLEDALNDYKARALENAGIISKDDKIVELIQTANYQNLTDSLKKYVQTFDSDFITVMDSQGKVIIRTDDNKKGDSLASLKSVQKAMAGESASYVEKSADISFAARASVPVLNNEGKIIGLISTGYRLDNPAFLDQLKESNNTEFTIFLGDERFNTTIIDDGKRMVGTKVSEEVAQKVLSEGKTFFGEANILGKEFISAYEPIYDGDNNAVGMMFSGVSVQVKNDSFRQTVINILISMALIVVLNSIVMYSIVRGSIKKPIAQLVNVADKIADGDLNINIESKTKDEIGTLLNTFKKMTDKLNVLLTNINVAADQVATGSRQIADSSVNLSEGATEQASVIEELTASIEEISVQTKANAANADQANELSETAQTKALKGNDQMTDMIRAMDEINESSNNISRIIKVIDDIAFQTNILALNAAVEAARAGQYGRGFAVVAEEVRNLAAKSANAAKETTAMIEESIKNVKSGTKVVKETEKSLSEIVEASSRVAELVNSIAVASNEQSLGIEQVNQGIMQVSQVVQNNSATAEESAAASEELHSQAEMLKNQVSTFKLKKDAGYLKDLEFGVDAGKQNNDKKGLDDLDLHGLVLSNSEFGKY